MVSTPGSGQSTICCNPCFDFGNGGSSERNGNNEEIVVGNAYDVIVIRSKDGYYFSNETSFIAVFPKRIEERYQLFLELNHPNGCGNGGETIDTFQNESSSNNSSSSSSSFELEMDGTFTEKTSFGRLTPFLRPGRNMARYLLFDEETIIGVAYTNIFLWSVDDKIIISDIDGTITKSNAGGIFDTILTESYTYCHDSVCQFFSTMTAQENQMKVLYVTSRPISLAIRTRKFIDNLRQQHHRLPEGPVLGFLGNIPQLLIMELVAYRTHHFKAEILWKHVVEPFRRAGWTHPFQAAFGNTFLDVQAYGMVSVPLSRTYLIKQCKIHSFDGNNHNGDDEEMMEFHLENKNNGTSWGNEMPIEWYKRKMGSVFEGYGDPRLQEHALIT